MLYVAPYTGNGSKNNPFRPLAADGVWSSIDLRPDPLSATGFALLWLPVESSNNQLVAIGNNPSEAVSAQLLTQIQSKLGVTFSVPITNVGVLLRELLCRNLGSWGKVRPSLRTGIQEVVINGGVWFSEQVAQPQISGLDPSDNFTRADSADLGTNWTPITGSAWKILSNTAQPAVVGSGDPSEYWNADTPSNDQFSEVTIATINAATSGNGLGAMVRASTSVFTAYRGIGGTHGTTNTELGKMTSGSFTSLATGHFGSGWATATLRMEAEGTTLRLKANGTQICSATDASIASGQWGLACSTAITSGSLSAWQGGNLVTVAIIQHPGSISVRDGDKARFEVAATGTGTLHYDWEVDSGGGFANASGATDNPFYITPTLTLSDDGKVYRCNISDDNGPTASNSATLRVRTLTYGSLGEFDPCMRIAAWF